LSTLNKEHDDNDDDLTYLLTYHTLQQQLQMCCWHARLLPVPINCIVLYCNEASNCGHISAQIKPI